MGNEDGKIEIGVGVNTEELDKYSKKLDKILKQMQQVNGTTVKSTSSVKTLDDKTQKLRETALKTVSGNGSRGLSLSPLLNKIPMYSKLSESLGNIWSGVNRIKESDSCGRERAGKIQNKTEHLSNSFEKLSTKANVAQGRLSAIAEKGGVVDKAAEGLSKRFSKLSPLIARGATALSGVVAALGPIGIAISVISAVITAAVIVITGLVKVVDSATSKMKEFASTADNLVKERRSYDPTTATEAGAYRHGLIRQTGKLTDKLGRLATTLANSDVIKFSGTLDLMKRRYSNVDDALDKHAKTTMRVTAFMDTLVMYLDSLRMCVLDLIEPIFSNTNLLKVLATIIDLSTTRFKWLLDAIGAIVLAIGQALSVIDRLIGDVIQFVRDIPVLGDIIKFIDNHTSHVARDFVDDMENVFKKYESGYYKDPYKHSGLYNTSFMDFAEERGAAEVTHNDDKDVTNFSLCKILDNSFHKSTKPSLDSGFNLIDDELGIILSAIKNLGESTLKGWEVFSNSVNNIGQTIQTKWESFTQTFTNWMGQLKENASNLISGFKDNVGTLASNIMKNASNLMSVFKNKIDSVLPNITSKISNILSGISLSSKSLVTPVKEIVNRLSHVMKHLNDISSNTKNSNNNNNKPKPKPTPDDDPKPKPTPDDPDYPDYDPNNFGPKPKQNDPPNNNNVKNNPNAKLKGSSGSSNSNSNTATSSTGQASNKTTPPKAYLKNSTPPKAYPKNSTPPKAYPKNSTPPKAYLKNSTPPKAYPKNSTPPKAYLKNSTPPKAYLKNSMSFTQVPYYNSNAFTLPETQTKTSAGNSNKNLELSNSSRSSSNSQGNELKILDPRDVDIKININTEKADKDFVEKMTEMLKKSFLDGLLHGY